jgi:hypothetical protein
MKANLDGSNAQTLDYPDYAYGGGVLSVNGSSVYTAAGSVNSVPIGGGAAVALIPGPGAVTCAIDDTNVYWVHSSSPAEIHKAPLNGDASVTVLTNQHTLATDYQNLALDDASVYWPNSIEHTLNKVTKDGVTQTVLMAMDAGSGPSAVVTDGVNLYWLQYGPAALMKMPVGGGAPVTMVTGAAVATPPSNTPLPPLAVDGTSVYWLNPPAIMKVAKN